MADSATNDILAQALYSEAQRMMNLADRKKVGYADLEKEILKAWAAKNCADLKFFINELQKRLTNF